MKKIALTFLFILITGIVLAAGRTEAGVNDGYQPGGIVGQISGPSPANDVVVHENIAYVVAGDDGVWLVDVTDPASLVILGQADTPGTARDVAIAGDYAYVADRFAGLRVYDVSNPAGPVEVGFLDMGDAVGVVLDGPYAYVADWDFGLRVIDVTDPATPAQVGEYQLEEDDNYSDLLNGVFVEDNYAYLLISRFTYAELGLLTILDVSNPGSPDLVYSNYLNGYGVYAIDIDNNVAFVGSMSRLYALNVENPGPFQYLDAEMFRLPWDLVINQDHLYVVQFSSGLKPVNGLQVFDVSRPDDIRLSLFYPGPGGSQFWGVDHDGTYTYVAGGEAGLLIYDISINFSYLPMAAKQFH